MNIWNNLPKDPTILAPMEGVTDIIFRQVVAHAARPTLFFTEFTNVSSFASEKGRANALARLATAPSDAPIIAQLWGTNPDHMSFAAQNLPDGFAGLDINMGCPERHVVATGGGSALIKTPELAAQLIAAAKTSPLPVSVKTRLGYTKVEEWKPWLTHLLEQDIAALTVHLRTKKEMSKVPAHHELIPEIIALRNQIAPQTFLNFNGDFHSRPHFNQILTDLCVQHTHSSTPVKSDICVQSTQRYPLGCMIGRGIFTNPFCFSPTPNNHGREELVNLLHYHLDLFDAQMGRETGDPERAVLGGGQRGVPVESLSRNGGKGRQDPKHPDDEPVSPPHYTEPKIIPAKNFAPLKKFFKIYINNFPGASDLRTKLMQTTSTDQVRTLLQNQNPTPSTSPNSKQNQAPQ